MGSNGAGEVTISGSHEPECSEATVEIKIKMLDSQTYTLRVDKCVPVPALKEQIATVTGVVSEQQRLICRGKVLKDDQLLSAYHVEDGHTLHLVVRQPIPQSSEIFPNHPASDSVSNAGRSQEGTRVVVGTFNIAEQGDGPDGIFPDLSRIVSAVLGSFGMTNTGSAGEGVDPREPAVDGLSRTSVPTEARDSTRLQADQVVLPDSLTTLNEYLGVLRHEFRNVGGHNSISLAVNSHDSNVQESDTTLRTAVEPRGLPRPQTLVEVMQSTRQILMEQAAECLSQLSRQLDDQENVTDPSMRAGIQSGAVRAGALLHSLGALLLELGRATMTLRVGQTPADTVVNAGPAVFISPSGPNPIMVQPLPFPLGTSFGTIPTGTVQPGSGLSSGTPGSGFHQRNVDIRIHTATGQSGSPSSTREPEIRVVPIRTVVAALPATVRRSPSDSSHRSVGLLYPVLARVQRVTSGNMNSSRDSQSSNEHNLGGPDSEQQPIPESVGQQQNVGFPGGDGRVIEDGEGFSTPMLGRLDQLLSSIFPGEQIRVGGDVNFHGTSSATPHVETTQAATNIQEETPRVSDEGILLSNFLHQIMPFISQNAVMDSNIASSERADDFDNSGGQASSTQGQEDSNGGTASRHRADPPSPPNSKRQRRE